MLTQREIMRHGGSEITLKRAWEGWWRDGVVFPARVVACGGLNYPAYLIVGAILLWSGAEALTDIFRSHVAALQARGEIAEEDTRRLLGILPGLLGIVATPFVIGGAALCARIVSVTGSLSLVRLLGETPSAVRAATRGLAPAAFAAAVLLLVLGLVSLLYDVIRLRFVPGALGEAGLIVAGAVLLSPVIARALPLLSAPIVAVATGASGPQVRRTAEEVLGPRVVEVTVLWCWWGTLLAVGLTAPPFQGAPLFLRIGVISVYAVTTIGGLILHAAPPRVSEEEKRSQS